MLNGFSTTLKPPGPICQDAVHDGLVQQAQGVPVLVHDGAVHTSHHQSYHDSAAITGCPSHSTGTSCPSPTLSTITDNWTSSFDK